MFHSSHATRNANDILSFGSREMLLCRGQHILSNAAIVNAYAGETENELKEPFELMAPTLPSGRAVVLAFIFTAALAQAVLVPAEAKSTPEWPID